MHERFLPPGYGWRMYLDRCAAYQPTGALHVRRFQRQTSQLNADQATLAVAEGDADRRPFFVLPAEVAQHA